MQVNFRVGSVVDYAVDYVVDSVVDYRDGVFWPESLDGPRAAAKPVEKLGTPSRRRAGVVGVVGVAGVGRSSIAVTDDVLDLAPSIRLPAATTVTCTSALFHAIIIIVVVVVIFIITSSSSSFSTSLLSRPVPYVDDDGVLRGGRDSNVSIRNEAAADWRAEFRSKTKTKPSSTTRRDAAWRPTPASAKY